MKKVLFITYSWFPSGGINVLRNIKFVKYLRKFGWEPIIFTAENADYASTDYSYQNDIPKDLTVIKNKIIEPYKVFKIITNQKTEANHGNPITAYEGKRGWMYYISLWIRSNFFIPDARALWISSSVDKIVSYCITHKVDAIFSDGPPHTNTRIACLVKQKLKQHKMEMPWLCDFQDPWTTVDYFHTLPLTKWGFRKHKKMEQQAFATCNAFTTVSPSWAFDLKQIGAPNPQVLYYGYDEDDFAHLIKSRNNKFTIVHAGMLSCDRIPLNLFQALAQLKTEINQLEDYLTLEFYGIVDSEVQDKVTELQLENMVQFKGNISRDKVLQVNYNADLLLLLINNVANAKGRIPAKLFEYVACKNPILCIGNTQSDVAKIMSETNTGTVFEYTESLYPYLKKIISEFMKNKELYRMKTIIESDKTAQFTNEIQTKKLAEILTSISI